MDPAYLTYLSQRCEQRHLALSAEQLERLGRYVALLLQWRRALNLTGLRQPERIIEVLVIESLDFLQRDVLPNGARVLDLGTGAGVPGVPLAICAPDLHLTLLERSEKKATFLRHLVPRLQLDTCRVVCDTAEHFARGLTASERFDAVVSRGVGRLRRMLRLAQPLLRPGGALLLRKPVATDEIEDAADVVQTPLWAGIETRPLPREAGAPWCLLVVRRGAAAAA